MPRAPQPRAPQPPRSRSRAAAAARRAAAAAAQAEAAAEAAALLAAAAADSDEGGEAPGDADAAEEAAAAAAGAASRRINDRDFLPMLLRGAMPASTTAIRLAVLLLVATVGMTRVHCAGMHSGIKPAPHMPSRFAFQWLVFAYSSCSLTACAPLQPAHQQRWRAARAWLAAAAS